jgi:hypothetical protein
MISSVGLAPDPCGVGKKAQEKLYERSRASSKISFKKSDRRWQRLRDR